MKDERGHLKQSRKMLDLSSTDHNLSSLEIDIEAELKVRWYMTQSFILGQLLSKATEIRIKAALHNLITQLPIILAWNQIVSNKECRRPVDVVFEEVQKVHPSWVSETWQLLSPGYGVLGDCCILGTVQTSPACHPSIKRAALTITQSL